MVVLKKQVCRMTLLDFLVTSKDLHIVLIRCMHLACNTSKHAPEALTLL